MKTMILAAVAALSLSVGSAYAAGGPVGFANGAVGYQEPVYGAQAFNDHSNETATHFLGRNTVLGKMFNHSNSNQVAATPSTKG